MDREGVGRFVSGLACLAAVAAILWLVVLAVVPGLFGWRTVSITSGSMSPAVHAGDIVVARPSAAQDIKPGTVAVFKDPAGHGLITHRIVARNPDGTFVTKGDANQVSDSTPLPADNVVGVARLMVPKVGLPAVWIRNGDWANVATLAVVVGFVLWHARYAVTGRHDPWRATRPAARRTNKVTLALGAAALAEVVIGSGALVVTQSARAAWTSPVSNGVQTFAAAPYHQRYLTSQGYPSTTLYPLSALDVQPTQTTLVDYGSDGWPGWTLSRGSGQLGWFSSSVGSPLAVDTPTRLRLWTSVLAFDPVPAGAATASLHDCAAADFSSCTVIATDTITSAGSWNDGVSDWVEKIWDFGTPNHTVAAGRRLAVRVTVPSASPANIMFAYDTTTYRSALQFS